MRSAACCINDFWDVNYDKKVERTKDRPLANKSLSYPKAFLFCLSNTFLGLSCLFSLVISNINYFKCIIKIKGYETLFVSMMISPLVVLYPLAKRFTNFP